MTLQRPRVPGSTRGRHGFHDLFLRLCLIAIIVICSLMTIGLVVVWVGGHP